MNLKKILKVLMVILLIFVFMFLVDKCSNMSDHGGLGGDGHPKWRVTVNLVSGKSVVHNDIIWIFKMYEGGGFMSSGVATRIYFSKTKYGSSTPYSYQLSGIINYTKDSVGLWYCSGCGDTDFFSFNQRDK